MSTLSCDVVRSERQTAQCLGIPRAAESLHRSASSLAYSARLATLSDRSSDDRFCHRTPAVSECRAPRPPYRRSGRQRGFPLSGLHLPLLLISKRLHLGFFPRCKSLQHLTSLIPPDLCAEHSCAIRRPNSPLPSSVLPKASTINVGSLVPPSGSCSHPPRCSAVDQHFQFAPLLRRDPLQEFTCHLDQKSQRWRVGIFRSHKKTTQRLSGLDLHVRRNS